MSKIRRILLKLIKKIKHERFCMLNGYRCPDCIYHEWTWEGTTFRGNRCRYGEVKRMQRKMVNIGRRKMRLINVDELKEWIENWFVKNAGWYPYDKSNNIPISELYNILERMPTVDAEPVVRCKDCKYMTEHYDTDGNAPYWTCSEWDSGTDYDGYCHYGERKEDE